MEIIRFRNIAQLAEECPRAGHKSYVPVQLADRIIEIEKLSLRRMMSVSENLGASMVYSDYRERNEDGSVSMHPVISAQRGSVRDDFDFGPLVMLNKAEVIRLAESLAPHASDIDGGWYALWLRLIPGMRRLPEYLYTVDKTDYRRSGQKQHDYCDPRNAKFQEERQRVFIEYLEEIGGRVDAANLKEITLGDDFPVEASVVIPVRNRVRTVGDAVKSALGQEADFKFNVIVVDNDSTDGTSELLAQFDDPRLHVIHVSASRMLGIGGCWNEAVYSEHCGRFAVQLDSDDLYSSPKTLQTVVDKFRSERCGMVVGSYTLVDFGLNVIPPGLIDHKEWTPEFGADNALRVNGFGAPRAFFTPVVREYPFPNTSYGEDYAMCLRVSREYKVGHIFDNLYFCRRWEGNSDADLNIQLVNAHNEYKDFVRTAELTERIRLNRDGNR